MMHVLLIALAIFAPMILEASHASRQERALLARGGIEPAGDVYKMMRVAYPGAFLLVLLESAARGAPSAPWIIAGAVLFAGAKALKWWAIASLGPAWTFRVIVVPGAALVTSGPYRYVRHPNYVAVAGELAGVALMSGAPVAGPIALAGFGALMWKRIRVEERMLYSRQN
jgi:methyltransferase